MPRRWYVAFPLLTGLLAVLALAAPFWHAAVVPMLVLMGINLGVRFVTDDRIGHLASGLRQCAPLIATAESLRFLEGDVIAPIVTPLHEDVHGLRRLKTVSRWVNGDPFILSMRSNPLLMLLSGVAETLYEYLNPVLLLTATGVYFGVTDMARLRGALLRVIAAAGEVDAAIAIASYRDSRTDQRAGRPAPVSPRRTVPRHECRRTHRGRRSGPSRARHRSTARSRTSSSPPRMTASSSNCSVMCSRPGTSLITLGPMGWRSTTACARVPRRPGTRSRSCARAAPPTVSSSARLARATSLDQRFGMRDSG